MDTTLTGRLFDIQGYSTHDGPGGRTLLFFKGCPLRCYWCCNPEGLQRQQQVIHRKSTCAGCLRCLEECRKGAITFSEQKHTLMFNRAICDSCTSFECTKRCYHDGLKIVGQDFTVSELIRRLERDRRFWSADGGVTLGGGEVMMQYPFVRELVKECRERAMHIAIETSGYAKEEHYIELAPMLDWIFMDIKHMDSNRHFEATGVKNELILKNIRNVALHKRGDAAMIVRIPCIIGFNDSEDNIHATAEFVKSVEIDAINLLPFHRLGSSKYEQLNMDYTCKEMLPPTPEDMARIKSYVEAVGLTCYIGNDTPF